MSIRITGQQKTTIKNLYGLLSASKEKISISVPGAKSFLEIGNLKSSFSELYLKKIFYIRQLDSENTDKILTYAKLRKTVFGNFKLMKISQATSNNCIDEPKEIKQIVGSMLSVLSV